MPRISSDPIKAFVSLRIALEAKRSTLLTEITAIDAALGSLAGGVPLVAKAKPTTAPAKRVRRKKNGLSLKAAVVQALSMFPLSKEDILAEVKKLGYQFTTDNPINSLNAVLYGKKPKFKTADGRFSLA